MGGTSVTETTPQIVHLQTTIQTVFGVIDAKGNAIPQKPVVVAVRALEDLLKPELGPDAHQMIVAARDQALESSDPV